MYRGLVLAARVRVTGEMATPVVAGVVALCEMICISSFTQAALVAISKHITVLAPAPPSATLGLT